MDNRGSAVKYENIRNWRHRAAKAGENINGVMAEPARRKYQKVSGNELAQ